MDASTRPERSGTALHAEGTAPPAARPWVRAVLRVPLFWKILLANVVLVAFAAIAVALVVEPGDVPGLSLVAVVTLVSLVLVTLVHAVLVRLALTPLDTLSSTAQRVRAGDWGSRAPQSRLADTRLERLRHVFNDMLEAISASRRRQRELARRVLDAEEEERERIANELYAGTAQTLAGVLVRLRVLARHVEVEPHGGRLEEVADEVRAALEEIRNIARRLRPPELDELGVRAALEAHARGLTDRSDLRVEFVGRIPEDALNEEARLALFRIVQEALTNAVRHADAHLVRVLFLRATDGLVTEVQDDGQGFDPSAAERQSQIGFGLTGMEERAGYAGGSFSLDAAPGRGTRVRLVLPWAPGKGPDGDEEADRPLEDLLPMPAHS